MSRAVRALWGGCCLAVMHALLIPPVDSVGHPAVRHLTTAVDTALSGSAVIGAFLRPGSSEHVDSAGQEVGDDALRDGTAGLFTRVRAAALLAGPRRSRLPAGAATSEPSGPHG